jgi:hypothetical protein
MGLFEGLVTWWDSYTEDARLKRINQLKAGIKYLEDEQERHSKRKKK